MKELIGPLFVGVAVAFSSDHQAAAAVAVFCYCVGYVDAKWVRTIRRL